MNELKKINTIFFIFILTFLIVPNNVLASDSTLIRVSLINHDPDPARNGEIVEVRLGVQNLGAKDSNPVILEFLDSYPFSIIGDSVKEVGIIKGYQGSSNDMKIIKFDLLVDKNAPAKTYDLKFLIHEEYSNVIHQTAVKIDVSSKEVAEIIYIDKTHLVPGRQETLTFTINNLGNAPINDVVFSWINDDKIILPIGGDNTRNIRTIGIGESIDLSYDVMADSGAVAGLYELSLNLKFSDLLLGERELNTFAGIYVGGETDFYVSLNEVTTTQVVFTVANIGSNPARSVSVTIPQQQGWIVTGPTSRIIGNLNPGDYTVANFNIQQASITSETKTAEETFSKEEEIITNRQPGSKGGNNQIINSPEGIVETRSQSNTLKLLIEYTDTKGSRESVEQSIVMSSTQTIPTTRTTTNTTTRTSQGNQSFFSKYAWYLLIGFLLACLFFYYDYKKKKRINDKLTLKNYFKI
ncbi:COG1361 S-layer family protein [Candidatus Woesearchaeota archaeon]|nr:COG1361 S-layer family protein [Candidatus Woesearchaeota archaeon]